VAPDIPEVIEATYRQCLAREPGERPTAAEALAALQAGAHLAGTTVYIPEEYMPHTLLNEKAHWHNWSIAYLNFKLYGEALERNERALALSQQLKDEHPELLANTLLTRGNILKELGTQALEQGNDAEGARVDKQVEATYQDALNTFSPATSEGRRSRAVVWKQTGIFHFERKRYAYADDAYARALALWPDMADTYFNRSLSQARWGEAESHAGHRESAIAHLRQARVYAATSLGMSDPTAERLLQAIETLLRELGGAD
jgi:tetratricopeptide (TPR) repeat protein